MDRFLLKLVDLFRHFSLKNFLGMKFTLKLKFEFFHAFKDALQENLRGLVFVKSVKMHVYIPQLPLPQFFTLEENHPLKFKI